MGEYTDRALKDLRAAVDSMFVMPSYRGVLTKHISEVFASAEKARVASNAALREKAKQAEQLENLAAGAL